MKLLNEMVRNIVVYLLLITIIMNLVGNGTYKKYIGIFTGMVMILMIVRPVMSLFHMNFKFDYYALANEFSVTSEGALNDMLLAENSQQDLVLQEYRENIQKQVCEVVKTFGYTVENIELDISTKEGDYGKIGSMKLWCLKTEEGSKDKKIAVQKIWIEDIELKRQQEKLQEQQANGIEVGKIKKRLADTYGLLEEEIQILLSDPGEE